MSFVTVYRPTVTTTAGGTTTSIFDTSDAYALLINTETTMTSSSALIQTCHTSSGTFVTLQSAGSNVEIFSQKGLVLYPVPFKWAKIVCAAAEAADVTFRIQEVIGV